MMRSSSRNALLSLLLAAALLCTTAPNTLTLHHPMGVPGPSSFAAAQTNIPPEVVQSLIESSIEAENPATPTPTPTPPPASTPDATSDMPSDEGTSGDPSQDPSHDPSHDPSDLPSDDPSGSDLPSDDPSGSDMPSGDPSSEDPSDLPSDDLTTHAAGPTTPKPTTTTTTRAPATTRTPRPPADSDIPSELIMSLLVSSMEAESEQPETPTPPTPTPPPATDEPTDEVPTEGPTTAGPSEFPTDDSTTTTRAATTTTTAVPGATTTTTQAPTQATTTVAPPPTTTPAPASPPSGGQDKALLLARATLDPPAWCIYSESGVQKVRATSCFQTQLMECVPWIQSPNEVAIFQYTEPANGTLRTNFTFFLVNPKDSTPDEGATRRLLDESSRGDLETSCDEKGVLRVRPAAAELPFEDGPETMSTLGVLFGFFVVFAILGAFIFAVLRKRRRVTSASRGIEFVQKLEDVPEEELECLYTKNRLAEEARQREADEAAAAEAEAAAELERQRQEEEEAEAARLAAEAEAAEGGLDAPLLPQDGGSGDHADGGSGGSTTESTNHVDVDDIVVVPIASPTGRGNGRGARRGLPLPAVDPNDL